MELSHLLHTGNNSLLLHHLLLGMISHYPPLPVTVNIINRQPLMFHLVVHTTLHHQAGQLHLSRFHPHELIQPVVLAGEIKPEESQAKKSLSNPNSKPT